MKTAFLKFSFWKVVGIVIVTAGLYSTVFRFSHVLGASVGLSDTFPWGLWTGFKLWCVCLAGGGFTLCAITHIFNIEQFKPLTRPSILMAFLGYILFIVALIFDLGKPWAIWHVIIMWNIHSVMFEVAWCVMLYTTVLFLEFAPAFLERFNMTKTIVVLKKVSLVIMIIGILLSTMHQSSLGSLFLIVPSKMYPLWYSPLLPVYFYFSSIATGFSMVIFGSYQSARSFGKGLHLELLSQLGFYSALFTAGLIVIRFADILLNGKSAYLFMPVQETFYFWLEVLLSYFIPFAIFSQKKLRQSRKWLYIGSVVMVCGAMLNRMNTSITSLVRTSHTNYMPTIYEVSITLMLSVLGLYAFKLAVEYLPVFDSVSEEEEISYPDTVPDEA
jgi:Ni/Fe-hydrogenase subunit HybB-like protein